MKVVFKAENITENLCRKKILLEMKSRSKVLSNGFQIGMDFFDVYLDIKNVNPEYALENLLRTETTSKNNDSLLFEV